MTAHKKADENDVPRVSAEAICAIVEVAGLEVVGDDRRVAKLRTYLASLIEKLIRKAPTRKPLTPAEMREVATLHDKFDELLKSFQGASNPPPLLPVLKFESGLSLTPWERWMDGLKFAQDGRPEMINWAAVGELLAIYQALFNTEIKAANAEQGETRPVLFLKAAFEAVRSSTPSEFRDLSRWYYQAPSVSALNKRLGELKKKEIDFASRRISDYLDGE